MNSKRSSFVSSTWRSTYATRNRSTPSSRASGWRMASTVSSGHPTPTRQRTKRRQKRSSGKNSTPMNRAEGSRSQSCFCLSPCHAVVGDLSYRLPRGGCDTAKWFERGVDPVFRACEETKSSAPNSAQNSDK